MIRLGQPRSIDLDDISVIRDEPVDLALDVRELGISLTLYVDAAGNLNNVSLNGQAPVGIFERELDPCFLGSGDLGLLFALENHISHIFPAQALC